MHHGHGEHCEALPPTHLKDINTLNITRPKDLLEDVAAALNKAGIDIHAFFERACTVTGEWKYDRSKARLKDRIDQKFCNERSVPLKFRTLSECLDAQPEASMVFRRLLEWIDRCDYASQNGLPKPTFETPDGKPIFPEDEDDAWWLTDVSRRVAAENIVEANEDGPATDDDGVEDQEEKEVPDDDPSTDAEEAADSTGNQHVPIVVGWSQRS